MGTGRKNVGNMPIVFNTLYMNTLRNMIKCGQTRYNHYNGGYTNVMINKKMTTSEILQKEL